MYRALVLGALLAAVAVPAGATSDNAGTTGFTFLKVGVGARPAALGGAFAGVTGDVEASAWNPAGLVGIEERAAALSLTRYLVDTQAGLLSVALPRGGRVWAASLEYFSYGSMRRMDEDGQDLGSFGAFDGAAYVSVAQRWWRDRVAVGANLKAVYSRIDDYAADAYMVDLGLLVPGPLRGMALGASLSNVGYVRSGYARGYKDSLPVQLRLGLSHQPAHLPVPMLLLADWCLPNDGDPYFAFGVEVQAPGGLFLRPGYSTQPTGAQGDQALGLTAGAGLALQRYRLDYAYSSYPDLGEVHRVSLNTRF
jgi:hypothetical protein